MADWFEQVRRGPLAALVCSVAIVTPLVIAPPFYDQTVMPRLVVTVLCSGLALAAVAAGTEVARPPLRLTIPALALVAVAALATALDAHPTASLVGEFQRYQGLLPLVGYVMLGGLSSAILAQERERQLLSGALVIGGTLAAGYAIADYAGIEPIKWSSAGDGRAGGLYGQPNVLALHLAVSLSVAVGLFAVAGRTARRLLTAAIFVMLLAIVLSQSRGGALAFACGTLATLALTRPKLRARELTVLLVCVGVSVSMLAVANNEGGTSGLVFWERAAKGVDEERLGLWALGVEMWQDEPLIGSGLDSFSRRFAEYRRSDLPGIETANTRPESAHNLFVDILVGLGAMGLSAWLLLFGSAMLPVILGASRHRVSASAGLCGGLIAYFVAAFFSFGEGMTGWLPWLLVGALSQAGGIPPAVPVRIPIRVVGGFLAVAFLVSGLLLAWADWSAGSADNSLEARNAVVRNPLIVNYRYRLGDLQLAEGEFQDAAFTYREATSLFGPSPYALLAEAQALFLEDAATNEDRILSLLNRAEELDPYNSPSRDAINSMRARLEGLGVEPPVN